MDRNILDFSGFKKMFESKKELKSVNEVINNVEDLLDNYFDKAKNVKYKVGSKYVAVSDVLKGDKNPSMIKFEVTPQDYKIGYDQPLNMDYTRGVLQKRESDVTLEFKEKSEDKQKNTFTLEFKIKVDKVDDARLKKAKVDAKEKEEEKEEVQDEDDDKKDKLKGF